MSKAERIIRDIQKARETIRACDEAQVEWMDELAEDIGIGVPVKVEGKTFMLVDIFEEGSATWRPARVHRYRLAEGSSK